VSIGNPKVSGNLKVTALVVFLPERLIDKTLGDIDIDAKYSTLLIAEASGSKQQNGTSHKKPQMRTT
jgi:hypothetical protein